VTVERVAVVVAHPDDEVIYCGGLIRRLVTSGIEVDVVCATGWFIPERMTPIRRSELSRSCWRLRARARQLNLIDEPGPLDHQLLDRELAGLRWSDYARVYTHGVCGEYGHAHHIQVCRAVHRCGARFDVPVFSLSGPLSPVDCLVLDAAEYATKCAVARAVYHSQPFAVDLCTRQECFSRLDADLAERLTATALRPYREDTDGSASLPGYPEIATMPPSAWHPGHRQRVAAVLAHAGTPAQNGAGSPAVDLTK
jgi:LmbE family N-acetylglucosaminyl deacetylase